MNDSESLLFTKLMACPCVSDVAGLYFPQYRKLQSAKIRFRNQIICDNELYTKLLEVGYNKKALCLTPKQTRLIIQHWGLPNLILKTIQKMYNNSSGSNI